MFPRRCSGFQGYSGVEIVSTRRKFLAASFLPLSVLLPRHARGAELAIPAPDREILVADDDALRAAVRDAQPGDHIVLGDGDHGGGGALTIAAGGTPRQPVVLRAARPLAARALVRLAVQADDVVVAGLALTRGCAVAGARVRVTHCSFEDTEGIALNVSGGQGVTVEFCAFVGCRGRGLSIDPNGKADAVSEPHIHHNYFADFGGREGKNTHEALQIGQFGGDALLTIGALVENNLFERVSVDSETISVKSSGNIIRQNTFLDCRSRPTNRFGNNNRWHANWIENCRGMWIYGAGHELVGNRVSGSRDGMCLMAGNTTPNAIRVGKRGGKSQDLRPHCEDVTLIGNDADHLIVGKVLKQNGEAFTMPAVRTRIEGQIGPIELDLEEDTLIVKEGRAAAPTAARLAAAEVGPGKP